MKPTDHQISAPTHASSRFFRRMFLVFFARTVPASRRAKPHCMKKTRKPQSMSQKVSALMPSNLPARAAAVISVIVKCEFSSQFARAV